MRRFSAVLCGTLLLCMAASASAEQPTQTHTGPLVIWRLPGVGWKPYNGSKLRMFGVKVDDCVSLNDGDRLVCARVFSVTQVRTPEGAMQAFIKEVMDGVPPILPLHESDIPPRQHNGQCVYFTFRIEPNPIFGDAWHGKVTCDYTQKAGKIAMFMSVWRENKEFTETEFDAVVRKARLR